MWASIIADPDIPKGSTIWIFDQTDMLEVKKRFQGWACYGGNVPVSLLKAGTPMGIWATWVPVGSVIMYNAAPALAAAAGWQAVWWLGAAAALVMMVFYGWLVRRPPGLAPGFQNHEPLGLRQALVNRDIWLLALAFACFNLVLVSISTYYPTFLSTERGYPLGQAAFISSIATIVILVSAPLAGWSSDRIGSRRLVVALPFLAIAVTLIFPFRVTG